MGININQKYNIIMLFKIKKSKNDEPQSPFSQLNQTTLYFALFTFLQSHNKYPTNFYLLFSV